MTPFACFFVWITRLDSFFWISRISFRRLNAFLEGFYDIIPKRLISIFNEQELELLISGLPNVDIEDLKANTEYHKYTATSLQVRFNIIRTINQLINLYKIFLILCDLNDRWKVYVWFCCFFVFVFFFYRFNGSGVRYEVSIRQTAQNSCNSSPVRLKCHCKVSPH